MTVRADDGNTGAMALSFAFPYYGGSFPSIAASTNGWVSVMETVRGAGANHALPSALPPIAPIAAFWDDLDLSAAGRMLFRDFGDRVVVTWEDVPYFEAGGASTFQVVLHADGRIRLQLLAITAPGSAATMGIESPDEADGLTVLVDRAPPSLSAHVVEITPPPPRPVLIDCASAAPIACGDTVSSNLNGGVALQDWYACSTKDYSGREELYTITLPAAATLRVTLAATSGDPDLVVLSPCDPQRCAAPPQDTVLLTGAVGTYTLVVDCGPGDEGAYSLTVECLGGDFAFCASTPDGGGQVVHDPFGFGNGSWLVEGWLYHPADTHDRALRVDGGNVYSRSDTCLPWPRVDFGAVQPRGPGFVRWTTPEGQVEETLTETTDGGCCGLLVEVRVTNTDDVPHAYEWRTYHDTAFGDGVVGGACNLAGEAIDGGAIEVAGTSYEQEVDLLAIGGASCLGQVKFFSADTLDLRASFEMLGPHVPEVMEFLNWDDGLYPCTTWSGLVSGNMAPGCNDNSLLLAWRFPEGSGTLAPGESGSASYRIGWQCEWPCGACAPPVMRRGSGVDVSPCNDGIRLTWDAASFPPPGNGAYHVYRSEASFADALLQPRISDPAGLQVTTFDDIATSPNATYFYVVRAESTDMPGCGEGPLVLGSTDELDVGPVTDAADLTPPAGIVGDTLRATGHGWDTVDFAWPLAPPPGAGEHYVILRSDDLPAGPFAPQGTTTARAWTDPAAPPRFSPPHVWFYDVRLADACDNQSAD